MGIDISVAEEVGGVSITNMVGGEDFIRAISKEVQRFYPDLVVKAYVLDFDVKEKKLFHRKIKV